MGQQLLCGAYFAESWGQGDVHALLVGEGGPLLGVVGARGMQTAPGITVDALLGGKGISLCLAKLDPQVAAVYVLGTPVPLPATPASVMLGQQGLSPTRTARPCGIATAFVAAQCQTPEEVSESGTAVDQDGPTALLDILCQTHHHLPAASPDVGIVLFAFYGPEKGSRHWHLEATGRCGRMGTPGKIQASGPVPVASFAPLLMELYEIRTKMAYQTAPEGELPSLQAKAEAKLGSSDHEEHFAISRRAAQLQREVDMERIRSLALQKALEDSQATQRNCRRALCSFHYRLEGWHRDTTITCRSRAAAQFEELLQKMPNLDLLEIFPQGQEADQPETLNDGAQVINRKLLCPSVRASHLLGRPSAATVGDVPVKEEDPEVGPHEGLLDGDWDALDDLHSPIKESRTDLGSDFSNADPHHAPAQALETVVTGGLEATIGRRSP